MGKIDIKGAADKFFSGSIQADENIKDNRSDIADTYVSNTVDGIAGNNKIEDTEIKVEPRRRGRRPKAVKYNAKILLTVTPEMRDKIFAFSDEVGMSVVEMLREAITDWMDAKSKKQ